MPYWENTDYLGKFYKPIHKICYLILYHSIESEKCETQIRIKRNAVTKCLKDWIWRTKLQHYNGSINACICK